MSPQEHEKTAPHDPLLLLDIHHSGYYGWGVWIASDAPEHWTAETVQRLMRHPHYRMGLNLGAQTYEQNPRFAERIREWMRMFPGRLFVTGGDYAQPTACVRTGESNVRQLTVGWAEIRRQLGVAVDIWTVSEPGNFAQLPQVLRELGYVGAVLRVHGPGQRGSLTTTCDAGCVWWEGPDGTRLPTVPEYEDDRLEPRASVPHSMWMMTRYRIARAIPGGYTLDDLWQWKERMAAKGISPVVMSKDDDHNDQPAINNLCMQGGHMLVADTEGDPRFRWVSAKELFDELPEPSWTYAPDPNLFETRVLSFCDYGFAGNKDWVADLAAEAKLRTADFVSVLAAKLVRDQKTEELLSAAWKAHLGAQNHDLSLKPTLNLMYHLQYETGRMADEARDRALRPILRKLNTGDDLGAVVVFNPLGWARREYATVTLPAEVADQGVLYEDDALVPWEVVGREAELVTMGFVADVPPLGYRTYTMRRGNLATIRQRADVAGLTVRTPEYTVVFGSEGGIDALIPAGEGRSVVQLGSVGIVGDIGGKPCRSRGTLALDAEGPLSVIAREAGRMGDFHAYDITYRMTPGISSIMVSIRIAPEYVDKTPGAPGQAGDPSRKIEFSARLAEHLAPVTCTRKQPMLVWPYDASMSPIFAALTWVDYGGKDSGLALLNRGTIGQRWLAEEGEVNMILLAGRISEYRGELALLPHAGNWRTARVHEAGLGYGNPLFCVYEPPHSGSLAGQYSLAALEPEAVTVSSVFRESGRSYIRVWEHAGEPATLSFTRNGRPLNVQRVSLKLRRMRGGTSLRPRQIATFRLP